ncbi:hypothetical protein [Actinotalea solisilvae]|uniref:hypothetical protein n=1 Tax=Actinotalea solisilvae TaxID=2072922 RepID=UPI00355869EB
MGREHPQVRRAAGHLDDLVALGSLMRLAARFLAAAVAARLNVLVSGAKQAGTRRKANPPVPRH